MAQACFLYFFYNPYMSLFNSFSFICTYSSVSVLQFFLMSCKYEQSVQQNMMTWLASIMIVEWNLISESDALEWPNLHDIQEYIRTIYCYAF